MLRIVITLEENETGTVVVKAGSDGVSKTATRNEIEVWRKMRDAISGVLRHTAHREYLREKPRDIHDENRDSGIP
jgi:hypothetical protein